MNWILISLGLFFLLLGYLIKYARWYWLIAGYNTATPEEKRNIDIAGLSHTMGIGLFVAGAAMIVFGVMAVAGFPMLSFIAMLFIPILLCLFLVWKSAKYTVKPAESSKATTVGMAMVIGFPLLVIVVLIIVGIVYSSRPPVITATPQQISISGLYGITAPMENIQEVKLLNEIPAVKWKSNGFGFANVRKGKFHLQDWGEGRLFIHSDSPPFIYLKTTDSYMLINYKDSGQTNEVYQQLYANWKK
jgi:hypothetical protein